jgi:hypothetical protein
MTKSAPASFKSINARQAAETPYEFEVILPNGQPTGILLKILGSQSKTVTDEVNRLMNARRQQEAVEKAASAAGGSKPPPFTTVENDIEFGQRITAARLVGWNFTEPCTPENALEFLAANADIAAMVAEKSGDLANFMKF